MLTMGLRSIFVGAILISIHGAHGTLDTFFYRCPPDDYFDGSCEEGVNLPDAVAPSAAPNESRGVGDLWSTDGRLLSSFSSGDEAVRSVHIQTDGRLVAVARQSLSGNNNFAIVRFFPDGEFDTGFGSNGVTVVTFGSGDDLPHDGLLMNDGKIVAVGRSDQGIANTYGFAVVRLNVNGTLDTTFNSNGKAWYSVLGVADFARSVALDTTSQFIVVGGYAWNVSKFDAGAIRIKTDGTLDTAFSRDGIQNTNLLSADTGAMAVAVQSDGAVVLAGHAHNGSDWDAALIRYLSNGALDTSFNNSGTKTQVIQTADDRIHATLLDGIGNIYIGGTSYNGTEQMFALARFGASGVLDTTFRSSGRVTVSAFTEAKNAEVRALSLQSDGKLYATGFILSGSQQTEGLVRLLTEGLLDTTFNSDGRYIGAFGTIWNQSMAILGNDYTVIGGRSHLGNQELAITRFASDGSPAVAGTLDVSFGTRGERHISGGGMSDITVSSDGKLVTVGRDATSSLAFCIARYNVDGSLDTSFASTGQAHVVNASTNSLMNTVIIQTDGKIVTGGRQGAIIDDDFFLVRLNSEGTLDTTFASTGVSPIPMALQNEAYGVVQQTDGALVAVGTMSWSGTDANWAVVRYLSSGVLDTTFHTDGYSSLNFGGVNGDIGKAIVLQPDARIVTVGHFDMNEYLAVAQWTTDGSLDTAFGTGGSIAIDIDSYTEEFNGVIRDSQNRIVAAGTAAPNVVMRFFSGGILDTSFQTDGRADLPGEALSTERVREISVGKLTIFSSFSANRAGITRLLSDGTLDVKFHTDGRNGETTTLSGNQVEAAAILPNGKACITLQQVASGPASVICAWQ